MSFNLHLFFKYEAIETHAPAFLSSNNSSVSSVSYFLSRFFIGIDVLMFGGDCLNSTARHLLTVSYDLIGREDFAKIAIAHLNRRKENRIYFKAI